MVGVGLETVKQIESQLAAASTTRVSSASAPAARPRRTARGRARVRRRRHRLCRLDAEDLDRRHLPGQRQRGHRPRASSPSPYMDRGDLVPDEVTVRNGPRPAGRDGRRRAAFCSTASRARSRRPSRSTHPRWRPRPKLDVVLELVVDDEEVVRRLVRPSHLPLLRHRSCTSTSTRRPSEGICDRRRWRAVPARGRPRGDGAAPPRGLRDQTAPLIAFYAARGILVGIDATGPVDDVTERALEALRRYED